MARQIDLRITCFTGPGCRSMTPVAGALLLLLDGAYSPKKHAAIREFELGKFNGNLRKEVERWCVEMARNEFKHALVVGFPQIETDWDLLHAFTEHQVVWFGGQKNTRKAAVVVDEQSGLIDTARLVINKLPEDSVVTARLQEDFKNPNHGARRLLHTIRVARQPGALAQIGIA